MRRKIEHPKMKKYKVQLQSTDSSFVIEAFACYTKGGLVCFFYKEGEKKKVKRFPLVNIHSIDSDY